MTNVVKRSIDEAVVDGMRLGRHVLHDPRSKEHPAEQAGTIKSVVHKAVGLPLDQGQRGSCTAEALTGALNSAPDFKGTVRTQTDAYALYDLEVQMEGYDPQVDDPGGTGLAVCKAAKRLGLVRSYRHAFGLNHALSALVLRPVIFGFNWYEGFDSPDSHGLVGISGQVRGGHEVLADELDVAGKRVGFWNSWGSGWGLGGRFYMSFNTVGQLLSEQGDCTVPVAA